MKKLFSKIINIFDSPLEALLVLVLFSISLYFHLESYSFKRDSSLFPLVSSGLTIILIITYIAKLIYQQKKKSTEVKTEEEGSKKDQTIIDETLKKVTITFVSFLSFVLLTYLFGFLVSSVILMITYPLILGYRKKSSILFGVIAVIALVMVFQFSLNIPLISGIFLDLSFLH
ncbi:MAG: tripartite tricarboxylate transporter TctB family protein [Bacillota bacterium]